MARKKSNGKRRWGGGEVLTVGDQKAIRWRESVLIDGKVKRRRRYVTLGPVSDAEADLRLAEKLVEARSIKASTPIVTFAQHTERWIWDVMPTYEWGVQHDYKWNITKVLIPRFGELLVSATPEMDQFLIRKEAVQKFVGEMTASGLAPHTVHHRHEVLRTVLKQAVQWYGTLRENPAVGVRLPRLKPKKKRWALTLEQAAQIFSLIQTSRARAAFWLLVVTGLRRGEYLGLRWQSIDEQKGELDVQEAYYRGHLSTPKTEAGIRKVPVDRAGLKLSQEWKETSPRTAPTDLVFGTRNRKPDRPDNLLHRHVWPACDKLKIERATYLTFRRTFATLFSNGGLEPKDLAEVLGHSEPMFYYEQTVKESQRAVSSRIGAELAKLANLGQSSEE